MIGKVTCKLCGSQFSSSEWIFNKGKCLNDDCIVNNPEKQMASRAQKKRAKLAAQEAASEAKRQERLLTSVVETEFIESVSDPDPIGLDNAEHVYINMEPIIERQIKTRRFNV